MLPSFVKSLDIFFGDRKGMLRVLNGVEQQIEYVLGDEVPDFGPAASWVGQL